MIIEIRSRYLTDLMMPDQSPQSQAVLSVVFVVQFRGAVIV